MYIMYVYIYYIYYILYIMYIYIDISSYFLDFFHSHLYVYTGHMFDTS